LTGCILFLIALFAVLNTESLATQISRLWRTLTDKILPSAAWSIYHGWAFRMWRSA
jgi:hypothetical protein